jgi:hypothetical protein
MTVVREEHAAWPSASPLPRPSREGALGDHLATGTKTIAGTPAPTFHPRICTRGLSQISNTYSPDRIKHPYKRVGPRGSGQWQRISWDEATSLIAENFTAAQRTHGKKSVWIAPYTGSLALIEGVVGAGFRFASVIGASAGDSEGDNEGDSATPAGWNYVLVDRIPERAGPDPSRSMPRCARHVAPASTRARKTPCPSGGWPTRRASRKDAGWLPASWPARAASPVASPWLTA